MFARLSEPNPQRIASLFCLGWGAVLLAGWIPVVPRVHTFIHLWRVELASSVFFLICLTYLLYRHRDKVFALRLARREINFIVLPLLAFVIWSGLSAWWSPSPKSALFHTLIWTQYLIFYLVARHILNTENGYRSFISLLAVILLIVGIPAIVEYGAFLVFGGETSLGIRYAKYGEMINAAFPLITVGVLRLNGRRFAAGLSVVTALWLFIIATLGRTNLLLFAAGLVAVAGLVFVLRRFRRYRRKMIVLILALALAPLLVHSIALLSPTPIVPLAKRVNNEEHIAYSANFRKLLTSVSVEMIKARPFVGVGAGNYGTQFNDYRAAYAAKNPNDINLQAAEEEIAERSHNEYLQILAELGAVGGLIFLWFLGGVGLLALDALKRLRRVSLFPLAALLGVALFLASSAVTSYSFRLVQNGFVFFFVLAVAAKILFSPKFEKKNTGEILLPVRLLKFGYGLGIAACLLLAVNCLTRAASAYYTHRGFQLSDIEQATPFYQTAFRLDGENPNAHFAYGLNLLRDARYPEAVAQFEQTIRAGRAASGDYSRLATAQSLAGDAAGAEKTFAEAARLYPLSAFVRARYASLLAANGKDAEAAAQFDLALKINPKQANTWWTLINNGARVATRRAAESKDRVKVMDLRPTESVYAVIMEREIKFPAEKVEINFGN